MNTAQDIYSDPAYKRSRIAYALQCTFEYFVAILAGDAFLAKLLTEMNIPDATIGIISSFISFAFLFQLAALFLVQHIRNVKRTATLFNTLSTLLFMCLYLLPFVPIGGGSKTVLVMSVILSAYFCNYLVTSVIFNWGNSFVNPTKRGTYSAGKEITSLIMGIIFILIVGHVFDYFEESGNILGGFMFIAIAIFIISIMNFISLLTIKGTAPMQKSEKTPFKEVLTNTVGNKNFVRVVITKSLWNFALYMSTGFMGVYKTKDLLFSVGAIQVINMVANLMRAAFSMSFGKFANKHGFARGLELGYSIAVATFLFNFLCTPSTRWCIVISTVLYNVALAGISQNQLNIIYSFVKREYFVQASAICNSISGIVGFVASLVGGKILSAVQAAENTVFGIHMYGQQFLSLISLVIAAIAVLYVHFVVSKQQAMIQ